MKTLVIVVLLTMLGAAVAQADNLVGWRIIFDLAGKSVELGAKDNGGGCVGNDFEELNEPGVQMGIGSFGSTRVEASDGGRLPLAETIQIWNSGKEDVETVLTWRWQTYDFTKERYVDGKKPSYLAVYLTYIPRLQDAAIVKMDPNGGSIKLKLPSGQFGLNDRVTLSVIPTSKTPKKR